MQVYREFAFGAWLRASSLGKARMTGKNGRPEESENDNSKSRLHGLNVTTDGAKNNRNSNLAHRGKALMEDHRDSRLINKSIDKVGFSAVSKTGKSNISAKNMEDLKAPLLSKYSVNNHSFQINNAEIYRDVRESKKAIEVGASGCYTSLGDGLLQHGPTPQIGPTINITLPGLDALKETELGLETTDVLGSKKGIVVTEVPGPGILHEGDAMGPIFQFKIV
ncbi:hypothetical protein ACOSQ3_026832 [Xanthoceras sorbifolium]